MTCNTWLISDGNIVVVDEHLLMCEFSEFWRGASLEQTGLSASASPESPLSSAAQGQPLGTTIKPLGP